MSEHEPSPEQPQYSREQVQAAFKPFIEQGITKPDDLPLDDPAVTAANNMHVDWIARSERQARQNPAPDAMIEHSLQASTLLVDAGFSDPSYLDEVANDWLTEDLDEAEAAGLTEVAARIQAKIDEINARIG